MRPHERTLLEMCGEGKGWSRRRGTLSAGDHVVSCEGANDGIGVTLGKDRSRDSNCGHEVFGSRLAEVVLH